MGANAGASSIAQHAGVAALELGLKGGQPVEDMRQAFQDRRVSLLPPSVSLLSLSSVIAHPVISHQLSDQESMLDRLSRPC